MMTNIKDVENFLNDYLLYHNAFPNCVLDNLYLFYKIAQEIEELLGNYFKNGIIIEKSQFTKMTLEEKMEIVNQYFKEHEIEFNIEKYINDGTIEFIDYNQQNENYDFFDVRNCFQGHMCRKNNGKTRLIDVCENGFASDICLLIHEISHFRDEPLEPRNQISDLLTESLAYAETLISADYLKELDFLQDAQIILKNEGNTLYQIAVRYKKVVKLFLVYMEFGNLKKESYQYLFQEEKEKWNDYEENIKFLSENLNYDLIYETWHLLGIYLGAFMLSEYKKDKSYMKNIVKLHQEINEKNFLDCMKTMGLCDLSEIDREKVLKSLKEIEINYFFKEERNLSL